MNDNIYDQDNEYFSTSKSGAVVLFHFKGNLFLNSTIFTCRDAILDYLDLVSDSDSVRVVVLMHQADRSLVDDYYDFYNMISSDRLRENSILRMYRTFDTLILTIVESEKFFISADSGKLVPSICNLGLACDYRIITEDTVVENVPLQIGLLPKGGGAFFLNQLLGPLRAKELLLSEKTTSREALSMGLVNQVVPSRELEAAVLEVAGRYARKAPHSLFGIKKLVNHSMQELGEYLEFENKLLLRSLGITNMAL